MPDNAKHTKEVENHALGESRETTKESISGTISLVLL
jgi:hypothetical protein